MDKLFLALGGWVCGVQSSKGSKLLCVFVGAAPAEHPQAKSSIIRPPTKAQIFLWWGCCEVTQEKCSWYLNDIFINEKQKKLFHNLLQQPRCESPSHTSRRLCQHSDVGYNYCSLKHWHGKATKTSQTWIRHVCQLEYFQPNHGEVCRVPCVLSPTAHFLFVSEVAASLSF